MSPRFLTIDEIKAIHRNQIELYGGSLELRDPGLLDAAASMPRSGFGAQYFHEGLADMAAAYLFHLSKNHPFVDGNKRVAAVAARVFLRVNGAEFEPPESEYEAITLAVAASEATKEEATEFFRKYVKAP
jgi:death on curing protein